MGVTIVGNKKIIVMDLPFSKKSIPLIIFLKMKNKLVLLCLNEFSLSTDSSNHGHDVLQWAYWKVDSSLLGK